MKTLFCLVTVLLVVSVRAAGLPAQSPLTANASALAAVVMADDERQAATKAGDRSRLEAIFSDELRYGHSSGKVDTKTSYIASLVTSG